MTLLGSLLVAGAFSWRDPVCLGGPRVMGTWGWNPVQLRPEPPVPGWTPGTGSNLLSSSLKRKKSVYPSAAAEGCSKKRPRKEVGNGTNSANVCGECGKSYSTKSGLGLHKRKAHAEAFHAEACSKSKLSKARWNEEEERILAFAEADLLSSGRKVTNVNAYLAPKLPGRTQEAIKKRRQLPAYRRLLGEIRALSQSSEAGRAEIGASAGDTTTNHFGKRTSGVVSDDPQKPQTRLMTESEWIQSMWDYLDSFDPVDVSESAWSEEALDEIIKSRLGGEPMVTRLDSHATSLWPHERPTVTPGTRKSCPGKMGRRALRRQQYAKIQKLYAKNRSRCAELVLSGDWKKDRVAPDRDVMLQYWGPLMQRASEDDLRPVYPVRAVDWSTISPVTTLEISHTLKVSTPSEAGPDGMSLATLKSMPVRFLAKLFNLWLLSRSLPKVLRRARTVLVPKVSNPAGPSEYRPITIGPMLVRVFHKILARRLTSSFPLKRSQRAFVPTDGCAESVLLLDTLMSNARRSKGNLKIMFLDLRKAFDSVHHQSVIRAAERMGCPGPLLQYLASGYNGATTTILGETFSTTRGVRQGDPLSPILFNAVIDEALSGLRDVGPKIEGVTINALGFADDVALVSETGAALSSQIETFLKILKPAGLEANPQKCRSLSMKADGKHKRWLVDREHKYSIGGRKVPSMGPTDTYQYLGIELGCSGRKSKIGSILHQGLDNITRAPLKPQQRLFVLRHYLFPKITYTGVLGGVTRTKLRGLDKNLRATVRRWLRLPQDAPVALVHAVCGSGGLGVPCLSTTLPLLRRKRLERLTLSDDPAVRALGRSSPVKEMLARVRTVKVGTSSASTKVEVAEKWSKWLHSTIDGCGLREANLTPRTQQWKSDGSSLLSGRDYIHCLRVHSNSVWTRARRARYSPQTDRRCPHPLCASANRSETLGHISQQCPGMWVMRKKRHDSVLDLLRERLAKRGYHTLVEPVIPVNPTNRRPDLVCWQDGKTASIIDVQIVSDSGVASLSECHARKVLKYNTDQIKQWVEMRTGSPVGLVTSVTINWRGCLAKETERDIRSLGVSPGILKIMCVRTLSMTAWMAKMRSRETGSYGWEES